MLYKGAFWITIRNWLCGLKLLYLWGKISTQTNRVFDSLTRWWIASFLVGYLFYLQEILRLRSALIFCQPQFKLVYWRSSLWVWICSSIWWAYVDSESFLIWIFFLTSIIAWRHVCLHVQKWCLYTLTVNLFSPGISSWTSLHRNCILPLSWVVWTLARGEDTTSLKTQKNGTWTLSSAWDLPPIPSRRSTEHLW